MQYLPAHWLFLQHFCHTLTRQQETIMELQSYFDVFPNENQSKIKNTTSNIGERRGQN